MIAAGAINPATVKPLLTEFMETAELDENGAIKGLTDELDKLSGAEETSYLFRAKTSTPVVYGASPAGSVTTTHDPKAASYESRLNDARQSGNSALAVSIKREAAADGVTLF